MSEIEVIKSDCRSCSKITRHELLFQHEVIFSEEFRNERDAWQVVRCLGCHTITFRHQNDDFFDFEENQDGSLRPATKVELYPGVIRNHKSLSFSYYLPPLIKKIYLQTLKAYGEHALIIAGIGLRACIEAVCNNLDLSGVNLGKRIDQLFRNGYVSNGDKKRLHAIRFLGNDAAHEIKEPNESEIKIALEIIEHLLNTVYILEIKAKKLNMITETYEEFVKLLQICILQHEENVITSLKGILGKHGRLAGQNLAIFEEKLQDDIGSFNISYISVNRVQEIEGKATQLYEFIPSATPKEKHFLDELL